MDHPHYPFEPIVSRRPFSWPGGTAVAVWVVLYLEYWELRTPEGAYTAPGVQGHWGRVYPDVRTFSYREYGNRVGIFRVLDVLDRHGIRATVAANAAACRRYVPLVEAGLERGYEFAAHGTHATRMITSRMTEDEERSHIEESAREVNRATGRRPVGWIGQDYGESTRTPGLLAEEGFAYCADWPNDDQPYLMTAGDGLVAIPQQPEWDDVQLLWLRQIPTTRFPGIVRRALDRMVLEGSGRVLGLNVHPWLFGQPHRIRYLDETLRQLRGDGRLWWATGSEIADAFRPAQER